MFFIALNFFIVIYISLEISQKENINKLFESFRNYFRIIKNLNKDLGKYSRYELRTNLNKISKSGIILIYKILIYLLPFLITLLNLQFFQFPFFIKIVISSSPYIVFLWRK